MFTIIGLCLIVFGISVIKEKTMTGFIALTFGAGLLTAIANIY